MADDKNLSSIAGGNTPNKFADMVRDYRDNIAVHIEYYAIEAKVKHARFRSLVAAGFTEAQALELLK